MQSNFPFFVHCRYGDTFIVEIVYYTPAQKLNDTGDMEIRFPKVDLPITRVFLQVR